MVKSVELADRFGALCLPIHRPEYVYLTIPVHTLKYVVAQTTRFLNSYFLNFWMDNVWSTSKYKIRLLLYKSGTCDMIPQYFCPSIYFFCSLSVFFTKINGLFFYKQIPTPHMFRFCWGLSDSTSQNPILV